jgi:type IV pilus assembly protein PilA
MKKMNNKGFSLVELIIVIAIMAILIAVLAPQYLRYVEKSRLQSDNSAIGEVANAVKVAAADDQINNEIATSSPTISFVGTGGTAGGGTLLQAELDRVVGTDVRLKSNTYTNGTAPSIKASVSDQVVIVTADNYVSAVGGSGATITF